MLMDSTDPYDGGGWGGTGGSSGTGDTGGETGGTDPNVKPRWTPGGNGWWEFWQGAWRWVSEPAPRTVLVT
jgi:hypothetical protein